MDYLQIRELYHDGIKGMKWGIRRYQNYDGTLTEEGRRRYNKNYDDDRAEGSLPTKDIDGNYYYTNKKGKKTLYKTRSEQLSDTELTDLNRRVQQENKLASETSDAYEYKGPKADQALRDASRMAKDISDALPKGNGKVIKKDYSYLSDQELRDRINRLQLEDNYGRLSGDTKYIKSGSEKAREFLQTAGALLAITGSAVALANTIADMQDKKRLSMQQSMRQSDILDENENTLEHHGILGQKWGIRRYQNEDGTLTAEGQARYGGKTRVDELSDEEKADLQEAGRKDRNKKIAIGVGVAAAAVTAGAVWLAKRKSAANMLQKPIDNLPHDDDNNTQSILQKKHGELDFGGLKGEGKTGINLGDLEENQKPRNLPDFLNKDKKSSVSELNTQNSGNKPRNLPDFLNTNKKPSDSNSSKKLVDISKFGKKAEANASNNTNDNVNLLNMVKKNNPDTSTQNSGGKPRNLPDFLNKNNQPSNNSESSKKLVDISKFGKKAEANASNNTNDNVNLLNMVKKNNPNTNKESDFSINGIIDKVNNKPIDSIKPTSTVSDKDISSLIAKIDGPSSNLFNTKTYQSTPTVSSGTQKIGDKSLTRTVTANFTSDDISDSKERSFLNRLYMPKERFDSNNEAEFTKKFIDTFGEAEYKKTLDRRNPFEARGYSTSISRDSSTIRPRGVSAKSSSPQSVKDKISAYKDSHKVSNSSVYVKNGALYKYHNGKEILVNGGANSRYEYTTNSSGQILRTVKKNFKPSWLRHYDNSDYLVFREMYLSSFDTLAHHGIKGQKWGVRRYQDQNGTLTPEGRKRYRSDKGTREIIENTSSYNNLSKDIRREYANYGRTSGGKKGFILGMGAGALVGAGKSVFDTVHNKDRIGKSFGYSSSAIVNRFVRNTMIGALGGSVVGTLIGSSVGKRSAQAELADKGHEYTSALMNVPLSRLLRSV